MRHAILSALLLSFYASLTAENIESYNTISNDYADEIQDVPIIRKINGGTVITPILDATCPKEMSAPFAYACKIVEEYMPPCLPLKVSVSCGNIGASSGAISRVISNSKQNFGKWSSDYKLVPMSTIKGVIMAELAIDSRTTYLDSVPNVNFLTDSPDINITYNINRLNELYFSLDTIPGQKFDFVSLAIRDLLIGLGVSSGYSYYPQINGLLNPRREMSPFEHYINNRLGNFDNPTARLAMATQGELNLPLDANHTLKLYAPTTWKNGMSLNYFIPQDDCSFTKVLAFDFCKGIVTRSLNDNYSSYIFRDLLGWKHDFLVGISTPDYSAGGNTSLLMPFNGSLDISSTGAAYGLHTETSNCLSKSEIMSVSREYNPELEKYISSFKPFLTDGEDSESGVSISLLKKDGTWDLVQFIPVYVPGMPLVLNMSEWSLHYENEDYARTVDGYLRARMTTKYEKGYNQFEYNSKFFVVDYLPQKIKLNFNFIKSEEVQQLGNVTTAAQQNVRLYFSDTEGVDHIMIECLREGFRVPNRIQITNVKKGYYDTSITRNTTFTAISYNENGHTRGVPVTVEYQPASVATALSFDMQNDAIMVKAGDEAVDNCNYSIAPLTVAGRQAGRNGMANGAIDISTLADGLYVLTAIDEKSGLQGTFKFRK